MNDIEGARDVHVEQGHDFVGANEAKHLRLHLALDIESPERQNGHGARLEVVITRNTQRLAIIGRSDLGYDGVRTA